MPQVRAMGRPTVAIGRSSPVSSAELMPKAIQADDGRRRQAWVKAFVWQNRTGVRCGITRPS